MFFKRRKNKTGFIKRLGGIILPGWNVSHGAKRGIFIILLLTAGIVSSLGFINKAGITGIKIDEMTSSLFGTGQWAVPFICGALALVLARDGENKFDGANIFGLFLFFLSLSGLLTNLDKNGGLIGGYTSSWLSYFVGPGVAAVILISGIIISLLFLLDATLSGLIGRDSLIFKILIFFLSILVSPFVKKEIDDYKKEDEKEDGRFLNKKAIVKEYEVEEEAEDKNEDAIKDDGEIGETRAVKINSEEIAEADRKKFFWAKNNIDINFPVELLKNKPKKPTSGNIDRNQEIIKQTLSDFGIPVTMGEVRVGPAVTQYTFKPSNGISVSKVKALSDDLALNLAIHPVRIEAPIPGMPLVGLEVPNETKVIVTLKEVIQSKVFKQRKTNTMIALGRDVTGQVWLDDLVKMPHLLVAGATGSGKSVCLHSIIVSLLYQNNPDDLKFILIDVKQVELSKYDSLPYLVVPVITENKKAIRALQWCLAEMERRLETLKDAGCQDISEYNNKKKFDRMPKLVVVVDELGDLLSTARKEAEGAIIRLGQKARAAGIHLILATQRPSVDILSGLIKANMPARIAFSVTSSINSKTILDYTGAEKLLGHGDMLFINSRLSKPVRLQGAYISRDEIQAVVKYAKAKAGRPKYIEELKDKETDDYTGDSEEISDDLLEEARRLIISSNKASATMLQSRLAIGYPRANRILDILERQKVVGPSIQNKPREVLIR